MSSNVTINTVGIRRLQIAYYDDSGTRIPSSGYTSYDCSSGELTFTVGSEKNIYIYQISLLQDGYSIPWSRSYSGSYNESSSVLKDDNRNSQVVNINVYPTGDFNITIEASRASEVTIYAMGITQLQIAYFTGYGVRVPSEGYRIYSIPSTGKISFNVGYGKHIYIYKIESYKSGYSMPWSLSYSGSYDESLSRINEDNCNSDIINVDIYPTGDFTIAFDASKNGRPDDWSWYSTIKTGANISLTAQEWTDFCTRINEFRIYLDLSEYTFITVSRGTKISANIVNQARTAISAIPDHGTLPSAAVSGGAITANFFNTLASALNSIP